MEILGYFCALLIGQILGLIGGGGSILTVPVMVYIFNISPELATAYSLFVVGITSSVGSVGFIRQKLVNYRTALLFGLPSILGILFSRRLVLPHLPHYIINKWGISLTKDMFILILFAILMLLSSIKMIRKKERIRNAMLQTNYTLLISQGLLVGIITGLIGAGGGFLIVPALVMLLGLGMREAIATSLFIIALNSIIGFVSSLDKITVDWKFLLTFSGLSVIGILIGVSFSKKIDNRKLKPIFGWFVLVMGIWIILNELVFKRI